MKKTIETIRNNFSTVALFIIATAAVLFSSFSPVITYSGNEVDATEITAAQLTAYTEDSLSYNAGDVVDELISLCFNGINAAEEMEEALSSTEDIIKGYAKAEYSICA